MNNAGAWLVYGLLFGSWMFLVAIYSKLYSIHRMIETFLEKWLEDED